MSRSIDYFSSDSLQHDLKVKTLRGGVYTVASQVIRGLLNLAAIPILARLLDPADFGLIAMITVVTGLAALFVDGGLTTATLQRDRLTPELSTNMFWVSSALGVLVAACVAAISPVAAWFYDEPRLLPITAARSLSFVFAGLMIQHQGLLRRSMQFNRLARVEVGSSLIGLSITIAAAWYYRNYWALVIMPIAGALSKMALTWLACPWRPGLPHRGSGVRSMLSFGGKVMAGGVADTLSTNVEKILLGRSLGADILGVYDQAWRLVTHPLTQINAPVTAVALPALSRLQSREVTYRESYLKGITAIAVLTIPLLALAIAAPDWVVLTVLTSKWKSAIPLFQVLAIAAVLLPITNSLGWLFISQGRVSELMRLQVADLFLKTLLVFIGLFWGAIGVAWALVIRRALYVVIFAVVVGRTGPVSQSALWPVIMRQIAIVAAGCAAGLATRQFLPPNLPPWQGLLWLFGPCLLACLAGFACLRSTRELFLDCVRYLKPTASQTK